MASTKSSVLEHPADREILVTRVFPPESLAFTTAALDGDGQPTFVNRITVPFTEGGGSVQMSRTKTFWSPLFGMCTDKFGIGRMVSVPGPQM